jgi:tetratricopeptide (TPR) repeat protein
MQAYKSLLIALALAGCAAQEPSPLVIGPTPTTGSLYSEFSEHDAAESVYGPFVAATLAQQAENHASAAHYYLKALGADPDSSYVADRAFFQLLYAGRMEEAARLAARMYDADDALQDDLVRLMSVLEAFRRSDWAAARQRLDGSEQAGFGFLISPLLKAWSFAAEKDLKQAHQALVPLLEDERLGAIAEEHYAYILDYLGKYDVAETVYLSLVTAERPVSLQPLIAYAQMMYKNGDRDGARAFLGEQVKRFSENSFLLREGTRVTGGYGPSQEAADPRGAAGLVFYRLATELAQGQSLQAAVVYLRIASYMTPEVSEIYFLLGNLLEQLDSPAAAGSAYAAVPPMSGLKPLADVRRIGALRQAGDTGAAEDMLRDALRETPNSSTHLISLGDMMREAEDFAEAVVYYGRAIDQIRKPDERDWFVFFARGVCQERLGNWPQAEQDLQMALRLNPGEASVLNYLGYSWIDRGENIDEAKAMIEQAVSEHPDDGFIVDSLGWVHYLTGDYAKAVEVLERAVRLEPTDPTINDHLGDAYWRVGRKIEARFQWQHALDNGAEDDERQAIIDKLSTGLPEVS